MSNQTVKNEQMRMYDNGRLFNQNEMPNNLVNAQDMLPAYQSIVYEQNAEQTDSQMHSNMYMGKSNRHQYVNAPKIVTQSESCYNKYSTGKNRPEVITLTSNLRKGELLIRKYMIFLLLLTFYASFI